MRNILFTLLVLFVIGLLQVHAQTPQDVPAVDGAAEESGRFLTVTSCLTITTSTNCINSGCKWCVTANKCQGQSTLCPRCPSGPC